MNNSGRILFYEGHASGRLRQELGGSNALRDVPIDSAYEDTFSFSRAEQLIERYSLMFVRLHIRPPNSLAKSHVEDFFRTREWFNVMLAVAEFVGPHFFVNHPIKALIAESKILQLQTASAVGLETPDFLFSNDPAKQMEFLDQHPEGCVVKPIDNSVFPSPKKEGDSVFLFTRRITKAEFEALDQHEDGRRPPPAILQEEIRKRFELRVVMYGSIIRIFKIDSQKCASSKIDSRWQLNNADLYSMISDQWGLRQLCRSYLDQLGLDSGVFDFAVKNDGNIIFFECNPNGQWLGVNEYAGGDLVEEVGCYYRDRVLANLASRRTTG